MDIFRRVFPFVWPHRRKLFVSFFFALLVAGLWSLTLSMTFLIVKVLLEGESLSNYVTSEIRAAEIEIDQRTSNLQNLEHKIEANKVNGRVADAARNVAFLSERAREQRKLSSASRSLFLLNGVKTYVMPWVPGDQFDTYACILGLLLLATVVKGICVFTQDVLVGSVVEHSVMGIRQECFRRALALDYQTLSREGTAKLMSRFTYDISVIGDGLGLMGGKIIREPLKALACILFAFYFNWRLTLLALLFVPVLGVVFHRYGRLLKKASGRMMDSMTRIYKSLEETFDAMKVVIAFDGGRRHRRKFYHENREYVDKAMKVVRIDALTSPTTELLGMLAVCISLLPGAYLVLRDTTDIWGIKLASGPMDISQLSTLYALLAGVLDPARKLSSVYAKLKRSTAAAERIFQFIDYRSLIEVRPDPKPLPRHSRSINFRDVQFTYAASDEERRRRPAALDNVTLRVRAGEVVAVVGENGSGKSTLVNLLPRFYDPDHGSIRIDGVDIRDVRPRDLRAQIGVVTQETLLFDTTIYENIRYGKPEATREEILAAAEQAHVSRFVEQLPEGYDTVVGEKGQRLSGGQRQRISLARAILRDPAILILDEATSAIDAQSVYDIHQVLREFVVNRTTFIITHSVNRSMLDFVTRIVVMDQGRIVADGPHDLLSRTSPHYQNLFRSQRASSSDETAAVEDSVSSDGGPFVNPDEELLTSTETADEEPNLIPFHRRSTAAAPGSPDLDAPRENRDGPDPGSRRSAP